MCVAAYAAAWFKSQWTAVPERDADICKGGCMRIVLRWLTAMVVLGLPAATMLSR